MLSLNERKYVVVSVSLVMPIFKSALLLKYCFLLCIKLFGNVVMPFVGIRSVEQKQNIIPNRKGKEGTS